MSLTWLWLIYLTLLIDTSLERMATVVIDLCLQKSISPQWRLINRFVCKHDSESADSTFIVVSLEMWQMLNDASVLKLCQPLWGFFTVKRIIIIITLCFLFWKVFTVPRHWLTIVNLILSHSWIETNVLGEDCFFVGLCNK